MLKNTFTLGKTHDNKAWRVTYHDPQREFTFEMRVAHNALENEATFTLWRDGGDLIVLTDVQWETKLENIREHEGFGAAEAYVEEHYCTDIIKLSDAHNIVSGFNSGLRDEMLQYWSAVTALLNLEYTL